MLTRFTSCAVLAAALATVSLVARQAGRQQPAPAPDPVVVAPPGAAGRDLTVRKDVDWLEVQVLLDRAGFSPGEIDAHPGRNTLLALQAFAAESGLPAGAPPPSDEVLAQLRATAVDVLVPYTIAPEDLPAEFTPQMPEEILEQAALPALEYRDATEALAERFHLEPALLKKLNAGARFEPGATIRVPAVQPMERPSYSGGRKPQDVPAVPATLLEVSKTTSTLTARDAEGRLLFHAPVTTGSEHDPLPIGEWKVLSVHLAPKFFYTPELFWDADPSHAKATVAPGPNNPVGLIWIDIDKEHYGLHGTPEPGKIGHITSHGCVRLTNWDALRVGALVAEGTRVVFRE